MNTPSLLRLATRQSPLALWQAHYVKNALLQYHPALEIQIQGFLTEGDRKLEDSLTAIGGKGLFIKELESALQNKKADIAVHSLKDMPVQPNPELVLVTICERADPRDAFISNQATALINLQDGAIVGTASHRRACLLQAFRPDLIVKSLRGNIGTRLQKLQAGQYDAIILAAAGLHRLQYTDMICDYLPLDTWIPAVAQGVIAIECHRDNMEALSPLLSPLDHAITRLCVTAERAFNQALGGSCQLPIAAHATYQPNTIQLHMRGFIADMDSKTAKWASLSGSATEPEQLGIALAQSMR